MKAKDMKKLVLCLIAAAVLTGGAACGNDNNTEKRQRHIYGKFYDR